MQSDRCNEMDQPGSLTEQAADWWILMNEGEPSSDERREFSEWIKRSPDCVGAYLRVAQLSHVLHSSSIPWPDTPVDALLREVVPNVSELAVQGMPARPRGRTRPIAMAVGLAAAAAAMTIAVAVLLPSRGQTYQTALGEQRSVVLDDGSLITLNTDTNVQVKVSSRLRHITLLSGEALFQVAHDASRPFVVEAKGVTIRDIGTQFNVDAHSAELKVAVIEGSVEVATGSVRIPLTAGQRMQLGANGGPAISQANVLSMTGWTRRVLEFEDRPLGEIAREFNRYNRQTIDIQSASLQEERITGVFHSNDPQSFLRFLSAMQGVSVESSPDNSRFVVRNGEKR